MGAYFVVGYLGPTNGTFVNGAPVTDLVGLHEGDRIEVGHSVIRYVARTRVTS